MISPLKAAISAYKSSGHTFKRLSTNRSIMFICLNKRFQNIKKELNE